MNKKINFPLFLMSLVPLGYILKGWIPIDITLLIYISLYLISLYVFVIKKERIYSSKVDALFFIWALILLIGTLYTPMQLEGLFKTLKFILLGLSLVFFSRLFIRTAEDIDKIFKCLLWNSIVTGYIVIADFMLSGVEVVRYAAFGVIVPIPLSMLGATTTLISILMYYYKKINVFVFLLAIITGIGMMTIAASKGPVISLLITLLLLIPALIKKLKIKFVLFLTISAFILSRIDFISESFDNLILRFQHALYDRSTSIRLDGFDQAVDYFYNSPIFGIGTAGGFPDYPHNLFLEILSENGVMLLMVFIVLIAGLITQYVRFLMKKSNNHLEVLILALLICSLVSLMFSFTYVDHKYLFLSIGLLLVYNKLRKVEVIKELEHNKPKKKSRLKRYRIIW